METTQRIGGVSINYEFYDGIDTYNDGDNSENILLDIFKNKKDVYDIMNKTDDINIYFHLSPVRGGIVVPMNITAEDNVLEVGSGTGIITSELSKKAKTVTCVDLSKRRCMINAYRNQDRDNITIYSGNFKRIKLPRKYDVIVLVGVLEYARVYIGGNKPFETFLRMLNDLLVPGGRIYIAIENRLGLKYFSGAIEDHWGVPFVGIEGYKRENGESKAVTFSKSELEKLLSVSGFGSFYFYYPLPDYKLPMTIYSDDYLPFLEDRIPLSHDFSESRISFFDELKATESLIHTDEFKVFANSFLAEGVKKA